MAMVTSLLASVSAVRAVHFETRPPAKGGEGSRR